MLSAISLARSVDWIVSINPVFVKMRMNEPIKFKDNPDTVNQSIDFSFFVTFKDINLFSAFLSTLLCQT